MSDTNYKDQVQATKERLEFSKRLTDSLKSAGYGLRPTEICRHFNIRYKGPNVTIHAVRKWLVGDAIPTQDKLQTLASWLNVRVDWLRFGIDTKDTGVTSADVQIDRSDLQVFSDFKTLKLRDKEIVRGLINTMKLGSK